jgi:hypothetical protein
LRKGRSETFDVTIAELFKCIIKCSSPVVSGRLLAIAVATGRFSK